MKENLKTGAIRKIMDPDAATLKRSLNRLAEETGREKDRAILDTLDKHYMSPDSSVTSLLSPLCKPLRTLWLNCLCGQPHS